MSYIFYVAPVSSDPLFAQKRNILNELADKRDIQVYFAINSFYLKSVAEILNGILQSSIVIVDLSFERPSVYFELGLIASTGQRLEAVAEFGTTIHQVPKALMIRYYNDLASYSQLFEDILDQKLQ